MVTTAPHRHTTFVRLFCLPGNTGAAPITTISITKRIKDAPARERLAKTPMTQANSTITQSHLAWPTSVEALILTLAWRSASDKQGCATGRKLAKRFELAKLTRVTREQRIEIQFWNSAPLHQSQQSLCQGSAQPEARRDPPVGCVTGKPRDQAIGDWEGRQAQRQQWPAVRARRAASPLRACAPRPANPNKTLGRQLSLNACVQR
jgi:hypothetical protein